MRHGLACGFLAVDDDPVSVINAELSRKPRRYQVQMAKQLPIVSPYVGMSCNYLPRDDQNVHGRLWINIAESQAAIIFVYDVGRYLTIDDLFE